MSPRTVHLLDCLYIETDIHILPCFNRSVYAKVLYHNYWSILFACEAWTKYR